MASTRISNDSSRIANSLRLHTNAGRYVLNVPGNGTKMPFQDDVFCRLQHFGANVQMNMLEIEDEFRGMNRKLVTKDAGPAPNDTIPMIAKASLLAEKYGNVQPFTDQSRSSDPAWMYRSLELQQPRWETFLSENPQNHTEFGFEYNISTRMTEKDHFSRTN